MANQFSNRMLGQAIRLAGKSEIRDDVSLTAIFARKWSLDDSEAHRLLAAARASLNRVTGALYLGTIAVPAVFLVGEVGADFASFDFAYWILIFCLGLSIGSLAGFIWFRRYFSRDLRNDFLLVSAAVMWIAFVGVTSAIAINGS